MGNSITSLRFLGANDWRDFVETHSLVEQALRTDPAQVYGAMDFATRDRYRHGIEEIAKRSTLEEYEIAQRSRCGLAERASARGCSKAAGPGADKRTSHVGYYLIDRGRQALELQAKMRPSPWTAMARLGRRWSLLLYVLCSGVVTAVATAAFVRGVLERLSSLSTLEWGALVPPLAFCATHFGIAFTNWLATLLVTARRLPRLDFSGGIPADSRTLIVVPSMLSGVDAVKDLLEGLEVRYLANRDDNLHFALLTDLVDAATETTPQDAELVQLAREGIAALNRRYQTQRGDIFLLFHRPRRWNPREGLWMGHERKRGKLAALNAFLRDGQPGAFSEVFGDTSRLAGVRYVITLDTDTQLPRDAAHQMVGAMAHALNRPVVDARKRRVVEGYGILQPRVSVSLPSARRSWFVRLFAGEPGVDPYTRVVSDVYQDLFGEGSFVGKGIYDVDAFLETCGDFPDNAVLSHDLLEGSHARSALLSDVELFEAYPSRYLVDVSRRHRWIRGDWQVARWVLPRVRRLAGRTGRRTRSRPSGPGLEAAGQFAAQRRTAGNADGVARLGFALAAARRGGGHRVRRVGLRSGPHLVESGRLSPQTDRTCPWSTQCRLAVAAFGVQAARLFVTVAFIAFDAYVSFDAIVRTTTRLLFTKRHLLEWTTASSALQGSQTSLSRSVSAMDIAPALTIETIALLILYRPSSLAPAAPLLSLWLMSPVIAWWLSRTLAAPTVRLSRLQRRFLRKLARKTWRFFEAFVTAEDNWLPPDNVQEQATLAVTTRTSPTNIGIALLANLNALDFGYLSTAGLLERTRDTLATLLRMERYRGHFFNWYDTRTREPLHPQYISTVDSGNLVGHLLVLRSGLLQLCDAPLRTAPAFAGIRDTAEVLRDVAVGPRAVTNAAIPVATLRAWADPLQKFDALLKAEPHRTGCRHDPVADAADDGCRRSLNTAIGADSDLKWWALALERCCRDHRDDLLWLSPWANLPPPASDPPTGSEPAGSSDLERLYALVAPIDAGLTLRQIAAFPATIIAELDGIVERLPKTDGPGLVRPVAAAWCASLRDALVLAASNAAGRLEVIEQLAAQCLELTEVDYTFLFDKARDLFAIGYNVDDRRMDTSFYDLLASEARLASFVAIAQGQVAQEHWFALGRLLTKAGGVPALLSWSGSMFEYLMPLLVMPNYENTLLDRTYQGVVRRQIRYGGERGVPWGISECGYNTVDPRLNYQYRAFGVPGLGLKRGLAEDLVIAPYATALALMVEPEAACHNLERLVAEGFEGAYGLYEAIDYTKSRLLPGASFAIVRQFMAHHLGMSLLSFGYFLLDRPMQRRFESDLALRANDLLLQERVPKTGGGAVSTRRRGELHADLDRGRGSDDARLRQSGRRDA